MANFLFSDFAFIYIALTKLDPSMHIFRVKANIVLCLFSIWLYHYWNIFNGEGKQESHSTLKSSQYQPMNESQQNKQRMKLSRHGFLVNGSRLLLQLALTSIFLFFFGLPAVKQFLAREVMVVKTMRESGGKIATPSISINARNSKTKLGWKVEDTWKYLESCLLSSNSTNSCIEDGTYSQNEVFNNVLLGYTRKFSLINTTNLWQKYFVRTVHGSLFTFNFPFQVGPDLYNDRLVFELSYDLEYRIYIHDPKYFVITSNNAYFPVIKISTNPKTTQSFFFNFDLTEVMILELGHLSKISLHIRWKNSIFPKTNVFLNKATIFTDVLGKASLAR